jgi:hypothetical protein
MAAYCLDARRDPVETTAAARSAFLARSSARSIRTIGSRKPSGAGERMRLARLTSSSSRCVLRRCDAGALSRRLASVFWRGPVERSCLDGGELFLGHDSAVSV